MKKYTISHVGNNTNDKDRNLYKKISSMDTSRINHIAFEPSKYKQNTLLLGKAGYGNHVDFHR